MSEMRQYRQIAEPPRLPAYVLTVQPSQTVEQPTKPQKSHFIESVRDILRSGRKVSFETLSEYGYKIIETPQQTSLSPAQMLFQIGKSGEFPKGATITSIKEQNGTIKYEYILSQPILNQPSTPSQPIYSLEQPGPYGLVGWIHHPAAPPYYIFKGRTPWGETEFLYPWELSSHQLEVIQEIPFSQITQYTTPLGEPEKTRAAQKQRTKALRELPLFTEVPSQPSQPPSAKKIIGYQPTVVTYGSGGKPYITGGGPIYEYVPTGLHKRLLESPSFAFQVGEFLGPQLIPDLGVPKSKGSRGPVTGVVGWFERRVQEYTQPWVYKDRVEIHPEKTPPTFMDVFSSEGKARLEEWESRYPGYKAGSVLGAVAEVYLTSKAILKIGELLKKIAGPTGITPSGQPYYASPLAGYERFKHGTKIMEIEKTFGWELTQAAKETYTQALGSPIQIAGGYPFEAAESMWIPMPLKAYATETWWRQAGQGMIAGLPIAPRPRYISGVESLFAKEGKSVQQVLKEWVVPSPQEEVTYAQIMGRSTKYGYKGIPELTAKTFKPSYDFIPGRTFLIEIAEKVYAPSLEPFAPWTVRPVGVVTEAEFIKKFYKPAIMPSFIKQPPELSAGRWVKWGYKEEKIPYVGGKRTSTPFETTLKKAIEAPTQKAQFLAELERTKAEQFYKTYQQSKQIEIIEQPKVTEKEILAPLEKTIPPSPKVPDLVKYSGAVYPFIRMGEWGKVKTKPYPSLISEQKKEELLKKFGFSQFWKNIKVTPKLTPSEITEAIQKQGQAQKFDFPTPLFPKYTFATPSKPPYTPPTEPPKPPPTQPPTAPPPTFPPERWWPRGKTSRGWPVSRGGFWFKRKHPFLGPKKIMGWKK